VRTERRNVTRAQLPDASTVHPQSTQVPDTHFQEQLAAARSELNSMTAMNKAQQAEIESAGRNNSSLNSRLIEMEQQNAVFQSERAEREARINQLEAELEKSKSERNADAAALAFQETELRELRKQVSDQVAALEQQRALAARGSDVRDLVVARKLHI